MPLKTRTIRRTVKTVRLGPKPMVRDGKILRPLCIDDDISAIRTTRFAYRSYKHKDDQAQR